MCCVLNVCPALCLRLPVLPGRVPAPRDSFLCLSGSSGLERWNRLREPSP